MSKLGVNNADVDNYLFDRGTLTAAQCPAADNGRKENCELFIDREFQRLAPDGLSGANESTQRAFGYSPPVAVPAGGDNVESANRAVSEVN